MGSGASNLSTQQIEELKQEVTSLKQDLEKKDDEVSRLNKLTVSDQPTFDFGGRIYKKVKIIFQIF